MPELPEVETLKRDLEKEVVGKRIKSVTVEGDRSTRRHADKQVFLEKLEGHKITAVERRGKYLLLRLEGGDVLVVHLGMSGQLLRGKGGVRDPDPKHTHVVFTFTQGGLLRFVDPRTFGEVFVTTPEELEAEVPELAHLGFDPVDDMMSWVRFGELLTARKTKLKTLLMDQKFVAGIGNIYSDEILWAAGPALRPLVGDAVVAGGPSPLPGHGRDPAGRHQAPGLVPGRRAVPRPVRRDRRVPEGAQGLRPGRPGVPPLPEHHRQGQGQRPGLVPLRAVPGLS